MKLKKITSLEIEIEIGYGSLVERGRLCPPGGIFG